MILFSHPFGNTYVRQSIRALDESGLLEEFWTSVSWNPKAPWRFAIPLKLRAELERRSFPHVSRSTIHTRPSREMARHVATKLKFRGMTRHETGWCSVDAIYRDLDRRMARRLRQLHHIQAVMASEDGALATFQAAKAMGIRCFYDLPIGYWRAGQRIYQEEAEAEPEWACTLTGMLDSEEKLWRKDEELRLADTILLASSFTAKTLEDAPFATARKVIIPYGAPSPAAESPAPCRNHLRVLFVGSLGQRKGISYLLSAVKMLGNSVKLTLVGHKASDHCRPLEEALKTVRWIPSLPHSEILKEMGRHDVLVFPSLFEGFGLVIMEALSQGLPVVTTSHTAGPDVLRDGTDGFIIPIRSSAAIAEKLALLHQQPNLLQAMKNAALSNAKSRTWDAYRVSIAQVLRQSVISEYSSLGNA